MLVMTMNTMSVISKEQSNQTFITLESYLNESKTTNRYSKANVSWRNALEG